MGMSNLDGYHPNKNESYQLGYQQGRADEKAKQNEFFNFDEVIRIECEKVRADEREKVLDEVIKTLAKSEDTMLSDKQYYTLTELKEQKNGNS